MKRFIVALTFFVLIVSSGLIVFSLSSTKQLNFERPAVLQNVQVYPLCFLLEGDMRFNPMLPYRNEVDVFSIDQTTAVFNPGSEIALYFDKEDIGNLSYEMIDPLTNEIVVADKISPSSLVLGDGGTHLKITLPELTRGNRYVLKLILESGSQNIFYYQSFTVGENDGANLLKVITKAHEVLFEGSNKYETYIQGNREGGTFYHADQDSSKDILLWGNSINLVKMNEPVPKILQYDTDTKQFIVQLKFTVAKRINYGFEYWDFTETFSGKISGDNVTITDYQRTGNRKNEPYFDQDQLRWVVDEGEVHEASETLYSEDGRYVAFAYQSQVYLLDKTYNKLIKIFGFDGLNSDYIMDEDDQQGIKLLKLENSGQLQYLVYGYMAAGNAAGHNGLLINNYSHKAMENETTAFVKLPMTFETLDYEIQNRSYFNEANKRFYILMDDGIYDLDLKEHTLTKKANTSGYSFSERDGLIYNLDNLSKENKGIYLMDLTAKEFKTTLLAYENEHIRVLGTQNGKLVVGAYRLDQTFEYLDGQVFYPYNKLQVLTYGGEVLQEISAPPDTFFQDVEINQEGFIRAAGYGLSRSISTSPNFSKVNYVQVSQQEKVYEWEKVEPKINESILLTDNLNGVNRRVVNYESVALNAETIPLVKETPRNKIKVIEADARALFNVYETYMNSRLVGVTLRFDEALIKAKDREQVLIYEKDSTGKRKLFYDSEGVASAFWEAPIINKYPELLRGCEPAALAMFLSYYTGENIDKMTLANQIRKDETPRTAVDGMYFFGNMHKGFVGSVEDGSVPGLGVYIEPIYDLASQYVDGLYNITGSSFEEVLNFVGKGSPAIVITTTNFNVVSSSMIQQWMTASGYMEITFKEHSVLIVGYDEEYVYFNDPDIGKLNKQTIAAFKAGWINQGSQALVVLK